MNHIHVYIQQTKAMKGPTFSYPERWDAWSQGASEHGTTKEEALSRIEAAIRDAVVGEMPEILVTELKPHDPMAGSDER